MPIADNIMKIADKMPIIADNITKIADKMQELRLVGTEINPRFAGGAILQLKKSLLKLLRRLCYIY
ncbi:hypothetical protein [Lysinibacillus sp. NPDC092081]|uniref:hypothetical protein n=1 Tax=Lysinibacillus sp. NPDC092081 TaxID=3364131 RepID=UPI00382CA739